MFGKKKEDVFGIIETVIGPESVFQGTLRSKSSIRIDGKLEGGIAEANGIIVGEKGQRARRENLLHRRWNAGRGIDPRSRSPGRGAVFER